MSNRERAVDLVYQIPENKLLYLIAFMEGLSVPDDPVSDVSEADPFFSLENQERLKKAAARMEAVGGTVHELIGDRTDDESMG